jgi:predicted  nucleic acid-binding Zn-ribbon protein
MSAKKRRLVQPLSPVHKPSDSAAQARRNRIVAKLDKAKADLKRWQSKMRRAFNTVEKLQAQIARLEKQVKEASK